MAKKKEPERLKIDESIAVPFYGEVQNETIHGLMARLADAVSAIPIEARSSATYFIDGENDFDYDLRIEITWTRPETDAEVAARVKEAARMVAIAKQWAAEAARRTEEIERAEYERLKAKFEGELT
jgi:hypothetical protein